MTLDETGVPLEGLLGVLHGLVPLLLVEEAERAVRVVVRHRGVLEDGLGVAVDGRVVLPQREVLRKIISKINNNIQYIINLQYTNIQ